MSKSLNLVKPASKSVVLYVVFCVVGAASELSYGAFWSMVGAAPWTYPSSSLHYTSLAVLPLWGLGGLLCVSLYRALLRRELRFLLLMIPLMALAISWILIYSWFT